MSKLFAGATGNAEYEAKVGPIRRRLAEQIPASLRLPESVVEQAPLDVTGIPATCGLLSAAELAITELDATAVCEKIAKKELTAVEVVTAFGKRAAVAHQLVNCLVDFFLDEGIAQAKALDEYYEREGKLIGPLHGLPVSIKDHMPIKGRSGSAGFLSTYEVSKDDCQMTAALRQLGAVFYVKTNQPQSIMHLETQSFYGRTLNPYNTSLTPGGSSGGEGALIAMRGSCMGVGTDIGGSIRNPAANCGIWGMRPTTKIMPMRGYLGYQFGSDGVAAATGPMCSSARDINTFIAAVLTTEPAIGDWSLMPTEWTIPKSLGKKLRVGIEIHDGVVLPQPPMLRALESAKKKLQACPDIEVVDYTAYKHDEGYDIVRELYFEDGGKTLREKLEQGGEDILPLTEWVISEPYTKDHSVLELRELRAKRDTYREEYTDYWVSTGCDVVLGPPFSGTANAHDTAKYWSYTAIWNLLDYPGIVFPSGLKSEAGVDVKETRTSFMSAADKVNYELYSAEGMTGAPVSFQLVARRFDDKRLVAAHSLIEKALKA